MRVMVTGASTPLGRGIVDQLLASDGVEAVLAVARDPLPAWRDPRVASRTCDLTHERECRDLVRGEVRERGIDHVVHASQHRPANARGRAVHAQNVDATRDLLVACGEQPQITRFVYRSFGEVYASRHRTTELIDEEAPLDFSPAAPQWVRDRVEADAVVCAHLGGRLSIAVLRCAEILAPAVGSQLWDYLSSRVCLRPLGFDPMLNVLSVPDAARACAAALASRATGVFNIPGLDTLPLSRAIAEAGRLDIPVPGPLLAPLYRLRRTVAGFDFRYDLNARRFHFGGVLDGARAREQLDYAPRTPVTWPASAAEPSLQRRFVSELGGR